MFAAALRTVLAAVALVTLVAQTSEPVIRVGLGPEDDSKPLVYAARNGLFAQAGLNVELDNLPGGSVIAAALAGGSLEIGKGSPVSVITAVAKGLPFTIIGGSAWYTSRARPVALIVAAKSDVRAPQDLVGKTLGAVTLQDLSTLATFAWLAQQGIDGKAVRFVEMPATRALAAMQAGLIVGMVVYEPTLSTDVVTGDARILSYPFDTLGSRFSMGVLYANVNWVNAHPKLVERFQRVMRTADAYVMAHERETVPLLAQFGGNDPAVLARIRHPERGVAIVPSDLQPVVDVLAQHDLIPKTLRAEDLLCRCAPRR